MRRKSITKVKTLSYKVKTKQTSKIQSLSIETKELIVRKYEELSNYRKVSDELGISEPLVAEILNEYGVIVPKTGPRNKSNLLPQEIKDQITERYSILKNMRNVGKEFKLSHSVIRQVLDDQQIKIPDRGGSDKNPCDESLIMQLYEQEISVNKISKH